MKNAKTKPVNNPINKGLMKVSKYARLQNKSTLWVYNQLNNGDLPYEEIDGVIFVKTK